MGNSDSAYSGIKEKNQICNCINGERFVHPLGFKQLYFLNPKVYCQQKTLIIRITVGLGVSHLSKEKTFAQLNWIWKDAVRSIYQRRSHSISEGKSILFMGIENRCVAIAAIADEVKESSAEAVKELKRLGIEVHMLTGDSEAVASNVAKNTGILYYLSGVLPAEKQAYVADLQRQGRVVAMVGDGINDRLPSLLPMWHCTGKGNRYCHGCCYDDTYYL